MSDGSTTTDATCCRLPNGDGEVRHEESVCPALATEGVCGECADWSDEFINNIKHDIRHSRIRRACINNPPPQGIDAEAEINWRLNLFQKTGKRDYLIDVARYAMEAWIHHDDIRQGVFN